MNWVIVGSVGGGVTIIHINTNEGMTYQAAQRLADEINTMYAAQKSEKPIGATCEHGVPTYRACPQCGDQQY